MVIILDTTELYDSFRIDSAAFRLLEDFVRRTRTRLVIPEIVILEAANHARKAAVEVNKSLNEARRQHARIAGRGDPTIPDFPIDEEQICLDCDRQLRTELRARFGAEILPIPQTALSSLIRRSLRQEKPFMKAKDGLRDALIWDSIIDLIRRDAGQYVFITNNIKDFPVGLERDLGEDAAGRSLIYQPDLRSFLESHKEGLNAIAELVTELRETNQLADFDLANELGNLDSGVLHKISAALSINTYSVRDAEEPYYISTYGSPDDIEVIEVFGLPEEIVIQCSATYECSVEGYVYKWDAVNNDAFAVIDADWNDHYAEVEFQLDISVQFLITLKASDLNLEPEDDGSYEVVAIEVENVEDVTIDPWM